MRESHLNHREGDIPIRYSNNHCSQNDRQVEQHVNVLGIVKTKASCSKVNLCIPTHLIIVCNG